MRCQPSSCCSHPKTTAMVAITLIALTAVALTALHMKGVHLGKLDPYMAKIPPYGNGIIFGGAGAIALVDVALIVRAQKNTQPQLSNQTFNGHPISQMMYVEGEGYDFVEFPACFYNYDTEDQVWLGDSARPLQGVHRETLVKAEGAYIPANRVLDGTYIIAACPNRKDGHSNPHEQQRRYYQAAVDSNVSCLFSVISPVGWPDLDLLQDGETCQLIDGTKLTCRLHEEHYPYNIYAIEVGKTGRVIYQFVPQEAKQVIEGNYDGFSFSFRNVAILYNKMQELGITLSPDAPIMINCRDGKDRSAGAVILLDRLIEFANSNTPADRFVDEHFWGEIKHLREAIERKSVDGAATDWLTNLHSQWHPDTRDLNAREALILAETRRAFQTAFES